MHKSTATIYDLTRFLLDLTLEQTSVTAGSSVFFRFEGFSKAMSLKLEITVKAWDSSGSLSFPSRVIRATARPALFAALPSENN